MKKNMIWAIVAKNGAVVDWYTSSFKLKKLEELLEVNSGNASIVMNEALHKKIQERSPEFLSDHIVVISNQDLSNLFEETDETMDNPRNRFFIGDYDVFAELLTRFKEEVDEIFKLVLPIEIPCEQCFPFLDIDEDWKKQSAKIMRSDEDIEYDCEVIQYTNAKPKTLL
ncbi:MAG TPA: hypothetical protein VL576_02940 [Candidatus Paceibacterota bacterium]|jgi:dihydrofolate reductase|nr:hypothetical protein [Candidatus Paceibacterota bacterium]